MAKKKPRSAILSESAQRIVDLMESISNGNQREFARLAGCSQPVISRIINGKQQPGRKLLERIAKLDGVDRDSLLATLISGTNMDLISQSMVHIAYSLLDGPPSTRKDQLTDGTVTLSPSLYRPSLYAVRARTCEPAFDDPSEQMRADDLIVIESSMERVRKNLQMLNGKLCVIVTQGENNDTITLKRVRLKYNSKRGIQEVHTLADSKVGTHQDKKHEGKYLRNIQFDKPWEKLESQDFRDVVDIKNIAGFAIELIRNL